MKNRPFGEECLELVLDLKKMGEGIPVVEKNARCLLSFVWALKFGISDVADGVKN